MKIIKPGLFVGRVTCDECKTIYEFTYRDIEVLFDEIVEITGRRQEIRNSIVRCPLCGKIHYVEFIKSEENADENRNN